jgi:hypothetical protein
MTPERREPGGLGDLDARLRRLIAAGTAQAARSARPPAALLRRRARQRRRRAAGGLALLTVAGIGAVLAGGGLFGRQAPVADQPPPASCAPAAFVPVLERELAPVQIASVVVQDCRDGYARVVGVPDSAGGDGVQAVLRDDGGTWRVLAHGRRIECDAGDEAIAEACARLGYG